MKVQWPKTGLILQGDCGLAKPYNTQLICIPPSSPVPQQRFLFFPRHIKNVSFSSHPELPPPFTPCKHLLHYFPFQMPFDSYLDFSHQIQVSRLYCYYLTPLDFYCFLIVLFTSPHSFVPGHLYWDCWSHTELGNGQPIFIVSSFTSPFYITTLCLKLRGNTCTHNTQNPNDISPSKFTSIPISVLWSHSVTFSELNTRVKGKLLVPKSSLTMFHEKDMPCIIM